MGKGALAKTRFWIAVFVVGLALSGITAFPLVSELRMLESLFGAESQTGKLWPALGSWITRVHLGLEETGLKHPYIFYGTDWLAFAHLVIASAFWGPFKDPVRNQWVLRFGMIACLSGFSPRHHLRAYPGHSYLLDID